MLATAIHDDIVFHNTRLRHSALAMRTPSETEAAVAAAGDNGVLTRAKLAKTASTVLVHEGAPPVSPLSGQNQRTPININFSKTTKPRDLRNATPPKPGRSTT